MTNAPKPKRSQAQKVLDEVRRKPSPTCRDARQLDLIEHIFDTRKREAFTALDEAIAVTLKKEGRP